MYTETIGAETHNEKVYGPASESEQLRHLRERVERLERIIFGPVATVRIEMVDEGTTP